MTIPKFSVLIGTMGSDYLDNILEIFLKSHDSLEIILMVDDPNLDIASSLPSAVLNDKRLKIITNSENIGLTRSLNIACEKAVGEIIVRNDDDDIPHENRLNEIEKFFDTHENVDIVYSYANGVDMESGSCWEIKGPVDHQGIVKKLESHNFIVHSTLAFRRTKIEQFGFYNLGFRFAQDYEFYLRMIRRGVIFGCIPQILETRQYLPTSITVSKRKKQILHSMSARLLHQAQKEGSFIYWPTMIEYLILLITPKWARTLRRRLGFGR